jgi:hypothetical protein
VDIADDIGSPLTISLETIMRASFNKFAAAAAVAISVFTVSGAAFAGATITDRQYWPNEIHSSAARASGNALDAFASMDDSAPATAANAVTYRGGPKTGVR